MRINNLNDLQVLRNAIENYATNLKQQLNDIEPDALNPLINVLLTEQVNLSKALLENINEEFDNLIQTKLNETVENYNEPNKRLTDYVRSGLATLTTDNNSIKLMGVSPGILEEVIDGFEWSNAVTNGWQVDYWLSTDEYDISGCMYYGNTTISLKQQVTPQKAYLAAK